MAATFRPESLSSAVVAEVARLGRATAAQLTAALGSRVSASTAVRLAREERRQDVRRWGYADVPQPLAALTARGRRAAVCRAVRSAIGSGRVARVARGVYELPKEGP